MINIEAPPLKGYRFPRSIIAYAVLAYHRFALSLRDVEDLLAERGVQVSFIANPSLGCPFRTAVCFLNPTGSACRGGQMASR